MIELYFQARSTSTSDWQLMQITLWRVISCRRFEWGGLLGMKRNDLG